jgi:hypothetical protein
MKLIMSYASICLSYVLQLVAFLLALHLSYPSKENRQAQEGNRNLNGFEYRYLNGLKVPYYGPEGRQLIKPPQ